MTEMTLMDKILFNPLYNPVKRYSNTYCQNDELLSTHVYEVMIVSFFLFKALEKTEHGGRLDLERVLSCALFHDSDEVITGDVPRDTKYFMAEIKESLDKVAEISLGSMSRKLDSPEIVDLWKTAKTGKEGFIIKFADMIVVVRKVWNELVILNNKSFLKIREEVEGHIGKLVSKIPNEFSPDSRSLLKDLIIDCTEILTKRIADKIGPGSAASYGMWKLEKE